MKTFIYCVLIGADGKNKNVLINIKDGQNHYNITSILEQNGYGDFKVKDWEYINKVTIINE